MEEVENMNKAVIATYSSENLLRYRSSCSQIDNYAPNLSPKQKIT